MKSSTFNVQSSKLLRLLVLPALLLCAETAHAASWQWIDGQRVQNYIKEGSGLWLIDVRNAAAYEAAHIEGSVNIPRATLVHKQFPAQKTLILVDDSLGQKAAREAADTLVKKGQERVSVLEGGITAWRLEGFTMATNKEPDHGVTAAELKWALANSVLMKIYDLRDKATHPHPGPPLEGEGIKGALKSESLAGKTVAERVEKLKGLLGGKGKKKDLAARMKKPQPIVLIFAAADDAKGFTGNILQGFKGDIRYLIGGYEAMLSEKTRGRQTSGSCPTCPGGKVK